MSWHVVGEQGTIDAPEYNLLEKRPKQPVPQDGPSIRPVPPNSIEISNPRKPSSRKQLVNDGAQKDGRRYDDRPDDVLDLEFPQSE